MRQFEFARFTRKFLAWLTIVAGLAIPLYSYAQTQPIMVPPGNRNAEQPEIPYGALSRTRATAGSFQGKYEKIRDLLAGNRKLQEKIRAAATLYAIEPIHIVGGLVGEHTYNVDALDHLQTYLVKAASYLGTKLSFAYDGESVLEFVQRPQFTPCHGLTDSYDLWTCRESVWNTQFRGNNVEGKDWPDNRFGTVFFQPLYAGQTFGLGQLNPLTALRVNDLVVQVSGFERLNAAQAPEVYEAIMDPDSSLHYMAAVIRMAIDAYAQIAGVDISGNPGITATLYNLGDVRTRAMALRSRMEKQFAGDTNVKQVWPQENYYGWLVNEKLDELLPLVQ
jgi:hypothetical protein